MWVLLRIDYIRKKQMLLLVDLYRRMKYNNYNSRQRDKNTGNARLEVEKDGQST